MKQQILWAVTFTFNNLEKNTTKKTLQHHILMQIGQHVLSVKHRVINKALHLQHNILSNESQVALICASKVNTAFEAKAQEQLSHGAENILQHPFPQVLICSMWTHTDMSDKYPNKVFFFFFFRKGKGVCRDFNERRNR